MSADVIEFPIAHKNEEIIALLEKFLEDAMAGKLKYIGVAAVSDEGLARGAWAPMEPDGAVTTAALGAVSFLGARFQKTVLEEGMEYEEPDDLSN